MLIDIKFASWKEASECINSYSETVLFNCRNYDHLLIYNNVGSPNLIEFLLFLDTLTGGDWLDLEPNSNYFFELDKHYATKTKGE